MKLPAFQPDLEFAREADNKDPLKKFRKQFYFSNDKTIYLDGNSLGRLPVKTKNLIAEVTENQWGNELIECWNKHWYNKSVELGNKIARITGASEGEIVISDSTSVNLYKLVHAALNQQKKPSEKNRKRTKIVSDVFNFPTDVYILQGIVREAGPEYELVLARSSNEISIDLEELKKMINGETALVVLSLVAFKSSFLYNLKEITTWSHQNGAMILWDLSHAAGAVPVELNNADVDFAVGCTYKFLNGGPGSPAFLYVRKDLQEKINSPIQGWFGDANPFEFDLNYHPAAGIKKFLAGTPPVLNQMAIEPGLDITLEAGIQNIHKKSIILSEYFIYLIKACLPERGFTIGSPLFYQQRGSHISLKHREAYRICQSLIHPQKNECKIIPDFREPDNIRFGITPLYTSFSELRETVLRLKKIIDNKEFSRFSKQKKDVT